MRTALGGAVASGMFAVLATAATAQDKIGVEACDSFITKYEACVMGKAPAAAQAQMKASVDQMRTMWKTMAADAAMKDKVAGMCQQSGDAIKQQMASFGCQW
jgi:hypothetical protein